MSAFFLLFAALMAHADPAVSTALTPKAPAEALTDFHVTAPVIRGEVKTRPLIAGDVIPDVTVKGTDGNDIALGDVLEGHRTVLIFARPETFFVERTSGYLKTLVPFFTSLDYQIVLVAENNADYLPTLANSYTVRKLFVDQKHRANLAMHLMDRDEDSAPALNGIFLTDDHKKIVYASASSSDEIPFSGEDLVLAARVYRDSKSKSGFLFKTPDESVLELLVRPDIANKDRWFYSLEVGGSLLEARQEIFLPRWQPGFQVGRRFGRTGVFFHFGYNESFDFTQEVKKLEVYNLGVGVDHLFLYGHLRTSASAGLSILGTQTDFDAKGTRGWFVDFRPLSARFSSFKGSVFEVTPLSANVTIPVARGIPLILFSYFTTVSLEFGG